MSENPKAVPALAGLSNDPIQGVSYMAVMSMAQIDHESASEALAAVIIDNQSVVSG
jgi:hypothetical protein